MSVIMKMFLCLLVEVAMAKELKVYWNIPTYICKKHGVSFVDAAAKFGIIQNTNDVFRGDKIAILYDPGMFPALLESQDKSLVRRNGGIPQQGNLNDHLDVFRKHINDLIPDAGFNGIGVIDFESWRPTFRQNFGSLQPYKDITYSEARKKAPLMPQKPLEAQAARQFEKFGRLFMEETINEAKKMRPNAKWGYYGLPYCFNGNANNVENCGDGVKEETDALTWLFAASDFLGPTVYIHDKTVTEENRPKMVRGRVREAVRASKLVGNKPLVLTYVRFNYADSKALTSKADMQRVFRNVVKEDADGVILWGSSSDLNSKEECEALAKYLEKTLGGIVANANQRDSPDGLELDEMINEVSWNGTAV